MNHKAVALIGVVGMLMASSGLFIQKGMQPSKAENAKKNIVVQTTERLAFNSNTANKKLEQEQKIIEEKTEDKSIETQAIVEEKKVVSDPIVYDNMTMAQLSEKLNRSLGSDLSGKGWLFATRSIELGMDPYLAVAIVLHETGCKWECSNLVKQCNNVGGQKGGPSCGNSSYKAFDTLDDGINGFLNNLYNNYYAKGLTTPEAINTKYAANTTWATKIYNYIDQIKAS